jgi:organic radical activating enzyme
MSTFQDIKNKLDGVGCGFCLAKWTQVTMHLHNGLTHSCHHPSPHKIPLREIERNPTALHNTRFKKSARREMLSNERPKECDYCWNVEDNSERFSDRVLKSSEPWSIVDFEKIKSSSFRDNFNPRYVEVSFSNTCNFKCSYCSPLFSSKWMEEVKQLGPYPTSDKFGRLDVLKEENKIPYLQSEHNPYVEAFWKWWPNLYRDLHTFRITGGEPLLSKDTWKVLDYIIEEPNPNKKLNLSINTNLGIPDNLFNKFIEKIDKIISEDRVNEFIVYTSCDTWGEQAEYIRNGLEFNKFWDNINIILEKLPKVTVVIMSTYNMFSPFGYNKLLEEVYKLKKEYANDERYWNHSIILDTAYLRYPKHQTVQLLDDTHKEIIRSNAEYAYYHSSPVFTKSELGFTGVEINKIKRIYDWSISETDNEILNRERNNFVKFVDAHDKRRGTNFLKTFPELEDLYYKIKNK